AKSNLRNAQRSTGPKSEYGKSRARFNAVKHGITAKFAVLPTEDQCAYDARRDGFMTDLKPRSEFEYYLIDRLVQESWISDRAQHAHTAHLTKYIHESMAKALEGVDPDSELAEVLSNPALYYFDPSDLG